MLLELGRMIVSATSRPLKIDSFFTSYVQNEKSRKPPFQGETVDTINNGGINQTSFILESLRNLTMYSRWNRISDFLHFLVF